MSQTKGGYPLSEHDSGFIAGVKCAAIEALRQVRAHIERLEPGKNQRIRDALIDLEGALYSSIVVRHGLRDEIEL